MTISGIRWRRSRRVLVQGAIVAAVGLVSVGANTDLASPPRFDGAGYAVLGLALSTGRGYREIHTPEQARHAHFPPGYPLVLGMLWRVTGRSVESAHLLSVACTVGAILAAWWWFRSIYPGRIALAAGLTLAANWTWGRAGGAIQSEPLYLLLGQLVLLAGSWAGRGGGPGRGVVLGVLLGACTLTRHVGAALAPAIGIDLIRKRRYASLGAAAISAMVLVLPWVVWLATSRRATQAGLFTVHGLMTLVASQSLFYLRRIPDQWVGPVVEIGTVFARSSALFALVNLWAVAATGLVAWGWSRALRSPRRRLAGLIPMTTLPLLLVWPFTEAGRFLVPLVPCLIVGAIEGLTGLSAFAGPGRARRWAAWVVLGISLPYPAYAIVSGRAEAQRAAHRGFDAASDWIARRGDRPGPVLTSHAAEVYWRTGREGVGPESDDPEAIDRAIRRHGVAYLVVDEARYARSPVSPMGRFVREHPGRVRRVWESDPGGPAVSVFEVVPVADDAAGPTRATPGSFPGSIW